MASHSSTDSENLALHECIQDVLWTKNLLSEIQGIPQEIQVHTDSLNAMKIFQDEIYHHGTRGIDFKFYSIRHLVLNNFLALKYVNTRQLPADCLTKNVSGARLRELLGVIFGTGG